MISVGQHPSSSSGAASSDAISQHLDTVFLSKDMATVELDTPTPKTANKSHSDPDLSKDYSNDSFNKDEQERLELAATRIQSVYRGYQARRELYGPALTASQKWRHLIDYSRIEYIHKMDATSGANQSSSPLAAEDPNQQQPSSPQTPNENKTRWAWRRAEFLGSRLGKGSNSVSTEEALVLLTEHWLEMSDKKHRYGSNLKPYHECWLQQGTSQNFFFWLDKGEGRNVDLEERPRDRLDEQRVQYLQDHERIHYAVHVIDGLLFYKVSGKLVHTLPTTVQVGDQVDVSQILPDAEEGDDEATRLEKKKIRNKSKFIYVTDPLGTLYVAQKVKGKFHHSSFLGGGTVCAAGGIVVNNGRLIKINPKSGHYRPGQRHFDRLLDNLKAMGISLEGVKISYGILEADANDVAQNGTDGEVKDSNDHLLLTLLGHVPGIVYAWWVIYTNREDPRPHGRVVRDGHQHPGSGRRTYVAVASTPPQSANTIHHYPQAGQQPLSQHQNSNQHTYTTTIQSGPVRTTYTTHTTQYVVPGPVDKKDSNAANPPPY
ncbi:hypothetical protein EMPS_01543 [Entomortierella parvispora]|uniref:Uncharacterized protein n=1 Tax=Entomortierella parvispora TaxID=205924 RepID=A0A9P3H3S3_9FUNG|nr:hypothetical protein EMPS_01543 [Entomortierella parvispora]